MIKCSILPMRLAELTHKIAAEDKDVRNLGDVVKKIQSSFPEITREQIIEDFSKLQGERRTVSQDRAAKRASKEIDVARQIMKEANVEARDQERAKKLIESFQTLKKNPSQPNQRKYMNARQQFLSEMIKSDRPWVNKLIKNADMEADLARFQKTGITKQEQSDLISKYTPKKRPEITNKEWIKASIKERDLRARIDWEIEKARPKTYADYGKRAIGAPMNLLRSVWSSFDLQPIGRQGSFALHSDPKKAVRSFAQSFKGILTQEQFESFMNENVKGHPLYDEMRRGGMPFEDPDSPEWNENFGSRIPSKIPLLGYPFRLSNRAYGAFINKLRAELFEADYNDYMEYSEGVPPNKQALEEMANNIASWTGNAKIGKGAGANQALGSVFYAPGYTYSKIKNVLGMQYFGSHDPSVRKIAARRIGRFYAAQLAKHAAWAAMGALGLIDTGEEDEEKTVNILGMLANPTTIPSELMKIPKAMTRTTFGALKAVKDGSEYVFDTDAGAFEVLEMLAQFWSGERESAAGETREYSGSQKLMIPATFARRKLNPLLGTYADIATGVDAVGMPIAQDWVSQLITGGTSWDNLDDETKAKAATLHILKNLSPIGVRSALDGELKEAGLPDRLARIVANGFGFGLFSVDK